MSKLQSANLVIQKSANSQQNATDSNVANEEATHLTVALIADLGASDEEEADPIEGEETVHAKYAKYGDISTYRQKWIIQASADQEGDDLQVKESERGEILMVEAPSGAVKMTKKEHLVTHYQQYLEEAAKRDHIDVLDFDTFCQAAIKNWWKKRKQSDRKKHKKHKKKGSREDRAARVIQRAWRHYIDREVFRYYRDLINFRYYGDPAMMLRCVNPKEASLLDAAAGIHVRFRLGGEKFPPSIYYKIFTHRPVQDICANAPRDYTRQEAKKSVAKTANNRVENALPSSKAKVGWYARVENNGWRLVSDRLLNNLWDPVTYRTTNKPVAFHHNKLKRKKDVEATKKKKKVEWMKKLYRDGILKANSDDQATISLVENAAEGLVEEYERKGLRGVKDWEVDELLSWTNALNFDDYWDDWKTIGTTTFSEGSLDKFNLQPSDKDPYTFSMSSKQRTVTAFTNSDSTSPPSRHYSTRLNDKTVL